MNKPPTPESHTLLDARKLVNEKDVSKSLAGTVVLPVAIDPLVAYGCVDWYLYPERARLNNEARNH